MKKILWAFTATLFLVAGCKNKGGEEGWQDEWGDGHGGYEPVWMYDIRANDYDIVSGTVASGEAMGKIFERLGVGASKIYRIETACADSFDLRKVRAGNGYVAFMERDSAKIRQMWADGIFLPDSLTPRRLAHFVYVKTLTDYTVISLSDNHNTVKVRNGRKPVRIERRVARAEITSSMWNAIVGNGLPPALAVELEDIFGWSVDFFGIQKGDSFEVIYDQRYVDTLPAGVGRIWGAVFHHWGKPNYAIPFKQDGKIAYWDENGNSLKKQFLKAPLKYSRISSRFSNARLHPILRIYRPHHGVDYAAPSGTPVNAVADGTVVRRGWDSGGGGNTLWIKHARGYETGYLHLRGYASGMNVGARVRQGQIIAYVGSTGGSTGPHLDYRIRLNGRPLDPLKIPQEPGEPIKKDLRPQFAVVRDKVLGELAGTLAPEERLVQLDSIAMPSVAPAPVEPSPTSGVNFIDGPK